MRNKSIRLEYNNLDLLRFVLAGTVCLVHAYSLSGYKELSIISDFLSSKIAVQAFFVVSGFLIFMSYERSSSASAYAEKRIRRILPAYIVAIMLPAISLLFISSDPYSEYFSLDWVRYVLANLTFLNFIQHSLPGVFEDNKVSAVNGALWTLKIEVMFYMFVPFLAYLLRRFNRLLIISFVYFSSVVYVFTLSFLAENSESGLYAILSRQLPGQLSYFIAGAFFYYFFDVFERNFKFFIFFAVLFLLLSATFSLSFIVPFAIATLVIFFGLFLYMGNFGKFGDFSYGIYILHFPIIQIFLDQGWFKESPWLFLGSVVVVTCIGAVLMWNFVEKRFLHRASHYIETTLSLENKNGTASVIET